MTYLARKLLRELWSMKLRGLLIILSIGMSIGIYGGLLLVKDNVFASRNQLLKQTNYEDGRLKFYDVAPQSVINGLLQSVSGITTLDYRLSLDVTLTTKNENFPSILHAIHTSVRPKVNDFIIKEGNYFSGPSDKVIVEQRFADAQDLHVGDEVQVSYGNLTFYPKIQAIVFAPEHIYSMDPTTSLPEKGTFAPIWFDIDTLMHLINSPVLVNEVLVKVHDKSNLDTILHNMVSKLDDSGYSSFSIRGDNELDYVMMREDIGTLDKFAVAIGLIILLVALFIIYDSILKLISSQTSLIGILRALGASTTELLAHYISFGMILSVLGIVVGIPLGYLVTLSSSGVFVDALGLELTTNIFRLSSFLPPILLTLSISFLASLLSTARIANLRPVEAINDQTIKSFGKKYRIEKVFDFFSANKFSMKIPVRQVFRRKRRTILTALTLALATMIILASYGFLDSFFHQMDTFYTKNNTSDMELSLTHPMSVDSIRQQLDNISSISRYEDFVRQPLYISGNKANESTILYAYSATSTLRHYTFKQGSLIPGEVAIGQILASKLGVTVGDTVEVLTTGKTQFDVIHISYKVSGITQEFFDNFVFMDLVSLQKDFDFGNMVTAVSIKTIGDSQNAERALYKTDLPIANVINLQQSKESYKALMEAMIGFAYFVIFLGVAVLILFSLNIIVLDISDREREFINMKINGASNNLISKIIILQVVLVSLLVLLFSYIITPVFTQFLIDQTMKTMAFIQYFMKPVSYGFGIISFMAGISVGLVTAINSVNNANIVEKMRLRFKN